MMEPKGYLTRSDKFMFIAAIVILIPLATIGFPFFAIGAAALIFGNLIYTAYKAYRNGDFKKRNDVSRVPQIFSISQLPSKPMKIRHHYTVNTSETIGRDD